MDQKINSVFFKIPYLRIWSYQFQREVGWRGGEREKDRNRCERETLVCPDWGSNPQPFGV